MEASYQSSVVETQTERTRCDYCTVETDTGVRPTLAECEQLPDGTNRCYECAKKNAHVCPGPCESGNTVYGNNQLCGECQHELIELYTEEL